MKSSYLTPCLRVLLRNRTIKFKLFFLDIKGDFFHEEMTQIMEAEKSHNLPSITGDQGMPMVQFSSSSKGLKTKVANCVNPKEGKR